MSVADDIDRVIDYIDVMGHLYHRPDGTPIPPSEREGGDQGHCVLTAIWAVAPTEEWLDRNKRFRNAMRRAAMYQAIERTVGVDSFPEWSDNTQTGEVLDGLRKVSKAERG